MIDVKDVFGRGRRRGWLIGLIVGLSLGAVLLLQAAVALAAPRSTLFIVSSDGDGADAVLGDGQCDIGNGLCTLRAAIQEANATPGQDTIEFGGMAPGLAKISLNTPLPVIADSVLIHGQTHPDGQVELDGGGVAGSGFHVTAGSSEIAGFRIHNFALHGIHLAGSGNNTIYNNIIGLPLESGGPGNGGNGILIENVISNAVDDNVIANNGLNGVELFGTGAAGNTIVGNRIGTNSAGAVPLGNQQRGVFLNNAPGNTIGGEFGGGNLISANGLHGIEVSGLQASGNLIIGNFIGSNLSGSSNLPNMGHGVFINDAPPTTIGGATVGRRNVISGNLRDGILIHGGPGGSQVLGNYVGTTADGLSALGNGESGVHVNRSVANVVGGTAAGAGNLIAGNGQHGVLVTSSSDIGPGPTAVDNVVLGNLIGTNRWGAAAVANGFGGVLIHEASNNTIGGTVSGSRNLISGNSGPGVEIAADVSQGNEVLGNYIGTNITGTVALPNSGDGILINEARANHVGDAVVNGFNLISGNGGNGIHVFGSTATLNNLRNNSVGANTSGAILPNQQNGIFIEQAHSTIIGGIGEYEGNYVIGNAGHGILISGTLAYNNQVIGNLIGADGYYLTVYPNQGSGIAIIDAGDNEIGLSVDGSGNLISGNGQNGILISGSSASNNVVRRNTIGANNYGNSARANSGNGISIINAPQNVIGGAIFADGNLISGNLGHGIAITGSGAVSNVIGNNLIGTDAQGNTRLPNGLVGVYFSNALSNTVGGVGLGNVISGNDGPGVVISGTQSSGNRVWSNRIGTNFLGTARLDNFPDGIQVNDGAQNTYIGGTAAGQGNLISGNTTNGIAIGCQPPGTPAPAGTIIVGNLIGVNITGTTALANDIGIRQCAGQNTLIGGPTAGARNLISGNGSYGIYSANSGGPYYPTTIQGNFIGVNSSGTAALANGSDGIWLNNPLSLIGGAAPGAGNLISGNGRNGINVTSGTPTATVQIQGNLIGADVSGNLDLGNVTNGIEIGRGVVVGGYTEAERNIISGNGGCGIRINQGGSSLGRIVGNYVGTNISGTQNLGNDSHGICFAYPAGGMAIGGTVAGAGNRIAFNGGAGIFFNPLTSMSFPSPIHRNSIFNNGGLGIDLTPNIGPTANDLNDSDFGPNDFQNFPVLDSVINGAGSTTISGTLNSKGLASYTIEFFASGSCDSQGYGEGETYLGSTAVNSDFNGNASFQVVLPVTLPAGQYVTMTATDSQGNTSEFSQCSAQPTAVTLSALAVNAAGPAWLSWIFALLAVVSLAAVAWRRPQKR